MKSFRCLSFVLSLFILGVLVIPATSAFAATQTVQATGTWRTITDVEMSRFQSATTLGNASSSSTNPELASGSAPGWVPHPDAIDGDNLSTFKNIIILDLPKVDLSCSSNVEISVRATGTGNLGDPLEISSHIAYQSNDLVMDGYGDPRSLYGQTDTSAQVELDGSMPVNPYSTAFGLKLILGAFVGVNASPISISVHDVQVSYEFDDMGGNCSSTPVSRAVTSCNDNYLSTTTQALEPEVLADFAGGAPWYSHQNAIGETNKVLTAEGYSADSGLEDLSSDMMRYFEVVISPQSILQTAGAVELNVKFNFGSLSPDEIYMTGTFSPADGSTQDWEATVGYGDLSSEQTMTTYIDSTELTNVRIYFGINTTFRGNYIGSNLSNLHVTVSHLRDVAVCGLSVTNSIDDPSSNNSGNSANGNIAAAGNANGTLPDTGASSEWLFILSTSMIISGLCLLRSTRRWIKRIVTLD